MASLSASAENLKTQSCDSVGNSMCLELALEGERLCKAGDCRAGIAFLQAAIQSGTDDMRTLSAIFSQLGNAYFYLGDYVKAMQFHKHDLTLARNMDDKLGEAKASGNLGNTLKVMGKFDEATICCKRHLEISRELGDKLSEGRALYNLGNVYHAKGKHIGRVGQQDPGEFSDEVKNCLLEAVNYYEENLKLMQELNDVASQGRACGNLGNTYYLLGDFEKAIEYHKMRLSIARQFGDKAAERRANSNLGNSHIFLGQFELAAQHYKRTLTLAQELGDRAVEAQACYSLGNTYTLLRDYQVAIDYHLRHLVIAQHLQDRVGEARAYWSLGNAHAALQNNEKALYFATRHYEISKELSDTVGETTARMNIIDLKKILGLPVDVEQVTENGGKNTSDREEFAASQRSVRLRRESMEQLSLIKLTPDQSEKKAGAKKSDDDRKNDDDFFDLVSKFQSKRMDDQRCTLDVEKENLNTTNNGMTRTLSATSSPAIVERHTDDLLDMIFAMQTNRMDEQRVSLPHLPGLPGKTLSRLTTPRRTRGESESEDEFFDMLARCQSSRLEEQRSALPGTVDPETESVGGRMRAHSASGTTVPDEDFFTLIMRLQSGRMEDQRATVPDTQRSN